MKTITRRRLGLIAAVSALAFVAGHHVARFDFDVRVAQRAEAPLARASLEVGVAGASVLVNYALGE